MRRGVAAAVAAAMVVALLVSAPVPAAGQVLCPVSSPIASQRMLDALSACTEIQGNVTLTAMGLDLGPLRNVDFINGTLSVLATPRGTTLASGTLSNGTIALAQLVAVTGSLRIVGDPVDSVTTNISMPSLMVVSGDLILSRLARVARADFRTLTQATMVRITGCDSLRSVPTFPSNLTVRVENNHAMCVANGSQADVVGQRNGVAGCDAAHPQAAVICVIDTVPDCLLSPGGCLPSGAGRSLPPTSQLGKCTKIIGNLNVGVLDLVTVVSLPSLLELQGRLVVLSATLVRLSAPALEVVSALHQDDLSSGSLVLTPYGANSSAMNNLDFPQLRTVVGELIIRATSPALSAVTGFASLESSYSVVIVAPNVTTLAFPVLLKLQKLDLEQLRAPSLRGAFPKLATLDFLTILDCDFLTNLGDAFPSLPSILHTVNVDRNHQLCPAPGTNNSLPAFLPPTLAPPSVFNYGLGCRSTLPKVCRATTSFGFNLDYTRSGGFAELRGCTRISGDATLVGVQDIDALGDLVEVSGTLQLDVLPQFSTLAKLGNLQHADGLAIGSAYDINGSAHNRGLTTLAGLESLGSVGSLKLTNLHEMRSLSALSSLRSLQRIELTGMDALDEQELRRALPLVTSLLDGYLVEHNHILCVDPLRPRLAATPNRSTFSPGSACVLPGIVQGVGFPPPRVCYGSLGGAPALVFNDSTVLHDTLSNCSKIVGSVRLGPGLSDLSPLSRLCSAGRLSVQAAVPLDPMLGFLQRVDELVVGPTLGASKLTRLAAPLLAFSTTRVLVQDVPSLATVSLPAFDGGELGGGNLELVGLPSLATLELPGLRTTRRLSLVALGLVDLTLSVSYIFGPVNISSMPHLRSITFEQPIIGQTNPVIAEAVPKLCRDAVQYGPSVNTSLGVHLSFRNLLPPCTTTTTSPAPATTTAASTVPTTAATAARETTTQTAMANTSTTASATPKTAATATMATAPTTPEPTTEVTTESPTMTETGETSGTTVATTAVPASRWPCPAEALLGVVWPSRTDVAEPAVLNCPAPQTGTMRRQCCNGVASARCPSAALGWLYPTSTGCISESVPFFFGVVSRFGLTAATDGLVRVLEPIKGTLGAADAKRVLVWLAREASSICPGRGGTNVSPGLMVVLDQLLEADSTTLHDAGFASQGAFTALVERFVTACPPAASFLGERSEFALQAVRQYDQREVVQTVLPALSDSPSSALVAFSNRLGLPTDGPKTCVVSAFVYRAQAVHGLFRAAAGMASEPGARLVSHVLTANSSCQAPGETLNEPVQIFFEKLGPDPASNVTCVLWDRSLAPPGPEAGPLGSGGWSASGCRLVGVRDSAVVCECSQLSSFAILAVYKEPHSSSTPPPPPPGPSSPSHGAAHEVVSSIVLVGVSIGLLGILVTSIGLLHFPAVRRLPQVVLLNQMAALFLALALFLVGIDRTSGSAMCTVMAAALEFFWVAAWTWASLSTALINIQVVARPLQPRLADAFRAVYVSVGWGLPLLFSAVSFGAQPEAFGSDGGCWLEMGTVASWLFVGVVLLAAVFNFALLSGLLAVVRAKARRAHHQTAVCCALALSLLLALTWASALGLVAAPESMGRHLVFGCATALYGLALVYVHCLRQPAVRAAWARALGGGKSAAYNLGAEHGLLADAAELVTLNSTAPQAGKASAGTDKAAAATAAAPGGDSGFSGSSSDSAASSLDTGASSLDAGLAGSGVGAVARGADFDEPAVVADARFAQQVDGTDGLCIDEAMEALGL